MNNIRYNIGDVFVWSGNWYKLTNITKKTYIFRQFIILNNKLHFMCFPKKYSSFKHFDKIIECGEVEYKKDYNNFMLKLLIDSLCK